MPKKKKKESLKERRRRAALKRERALEAERIRREKEPKKKGKGWPKGKVFGALFLISLCLISYGAWQYTQPPSPEVAPLFTLTDIDENRFSLADFRQRVVVVDFFYCQCQYCDTEILHLEEIYETYRNDVEVVSISIEENTIEDLREFRTGPNRFSNLEYEISWRVARDTDHVVEKYKIKGYPTTIIIDQEGNISPHSPYIGLTDASTLSNEIEYLLGRS